MIEKAAVRDMSINVLWQDVFGFQFQMYLCDDDDVFTKKWRSRPTVVIEC